MSFRLRISSSDAVPALTTEDFLWRPRPKNSSLATSISPRLEELGAIDDLHVDFVSLATIVYLTDRTAQRPKRGWDRQLDIQLPVSDPSHWSGFSEAVEDLLRFLTGDQWSVNFSTRRGGKGGDAVEPALDGATALFSGGADSLSGAVVLGQDGPPTLVSHWAAKGAKPIQANLIAELEKQWGSPPEHLQIHLGRHGKQLGTGDEFSDEPSSRSRSLLFIALGLAAASVRGGELTMPENGFTSLNIPLSPERRGALSTRTTHPAFIAGLNGLLNEIGIRTKVSNPFRDLTKGQLLAEIKGILGSRKASELLGKSHSCARSDMFRFGLSPLAHCGVCFGCLVRRGAFIAAKLTDRTTYANEVLTGSNRARFFAGKRLSTWESVRYAVEGGFGIRDVLAVGLPSDQNIDEATKLVNAGLAELAAVNITHP